MTQLAIMLELQDRMNSKINPEWKTAGNNWLRAAWIEGAESMGHIGWKWWKKETPNLAQLKIELVDIWHFLISKAIIYKADDAESWLNSGWCNSDSVPCPYSTDISYNLKEMELIDLVEIFAGMAALQAPLAYVVSIFKAIQHKVDMSDDELYQGYIAKNVLNFFRQDHGYKTGEYIKNWNIDPTTSNEVEDNVVLELLSKDLIEANRFGDVALYNALGVYYHKVVEFNAVQAKTSEAASDATYALKG